MQTIRVAAFTGGRNVPSARFRIRQLTRPLRDAGVELTEYISKAGRYPPAGSLRRPVWAVHNLVEHALTVPRSHFFDATIFQRELFSTFVTLEPLARRPRILDVDDAIWLSRGGGFARRLARLSDLVICGNQYLAEWFGSEGAMRVTVLPTAVDSDRFAPIPRGAQSDRPVIGWSGSSSGLKEVYAIERVLGAVLQAVPGSQLRIISDQPPRFGSIPSDRWTFVPWSPVQESAALQDLTVGIMPLGDTEWNRGKCSYKMLTYMSCAVPVVVSPVGMNADVLRMGNVGVGARSEDEWFDALTMLLRDHNVAREMGGGGRTVIEQSFSLSAVAPALAREIRYVCA